MNLIDTFRGFARRWYIVLPGVLVAAALSVGAWHFAKPQYVRSATQLLLPGVGTLPQTSPNPYLFISGLTDAADVMVRTVGSTNVINDISSHYPDVGIQVTRDPTTSGPVILTTVTADSDKDATAVLDLLVRRTQTTLEELQTQENIAPRNHITVTTLSIDNKSELKQRKRLVVTAGSAGVTLVLTLLVASIVDGLLMARRQSRELESPDPKSQTDGARDDSANHDGVAADAPASHPSVEDDTAPPDQTDDRLLDQARTYASAARSISGDDSSPTPRSD